MLDCAEMHVFPCTTDPSSRIGSGFLSNLTVRVPLIIHVLGVTDQDDYDHKTGELMDLVDVFPTISALAGLPLPQNVDGMDLSFLVTKSHNEARRDVPRGRTAAYHQFPACRTKSFHSIRGDCNNVNATDFDFMGYSIRTNDWRYTAWYYWNGTVLSAEWDGDYVDELYYHKGDDSTDFGSWENENLSAKRTDVASGLRSQLESFFRRQDSTSGLSNGMDAAISQSIT